MSTQVNPARAAIFATLHSALQRGPLDEAERAALDARIAQPPRHIRPAQDEDNLARFVRKFESRAGTTQRVASLADVPAAVEAYRLAKALPARVMMGASPGSPTTHNFVPDDHVVVLEVGCIVPYFEDAWAFLRARPEGMPRATNIISGPSRTADVEQTIQLGAHGPRRVHVILVG